MGCCRGMPWAEIRAFAEHHVARNAARATRLCNIRGVANGVRVRTRGLWRREARHGVRQTLPDECSGDTHHFFAAFFFFGAGAAAAFFAIVRWVGGSAVREGLLPGRVRRFPPISVSGETQEGTTDLRLSGIFRDLNSAEFQGHLANRQNASSQGFSRERFWGTPIGILRIGNLRTLP